MEWTTLIGAILGSAFAGAMINLIAERLRRKDTVTDRKENVEDQIEELRTETAEQFEQVNERFKGMDTKMDTVAQSMTSVVLSTKAQAYDRIRHLGMAYIKAGAVTDDELRNLIEMHEAYRALGGDGFLDKVMSEVYKLRIKP